MTREERVKFCKVCDKSKFDTRQGIVCGLTNAKADFEEECPDFTGNNEEVYVYQPPEAKKGLLAEKTIGFFELLTPKPGFFMSPIIIIFCVLVFISMVLSGVHLIDPTVENLVAWGANFTTLTFQGQYWRLLSNCFLHIGLIHLLFNMYALLYIGLLLEPIIGKWKLGFAFILTGIAGSLLSLAWHDMIVSAGASGAIFGLYGVYLALLTTNLIDKESKKGILVSILIFVGYNLLFGLKGGIDNAAHIGGLFSGILLGFSFYPSLSNQEAKLKGLLIPGLTFIFIVCCGFIVLRSPKISVIYETHMSEFVELEQKALSVYPQYITEANLDAINKDGIPNWQKCKDLILKLDEMSGFSEEIYQRNALLKRYCDYRIESYKLIAKASEDRTPIFFRQVEAYNQTIAYIIRKLKGEVIADNLIRYKAPVEYKPVQREVFRSTENTQSPLYIIDGKITEDMMHIDPKNIKEMNVMKGAAAEAVYGDKGKYGVVIITTK
ncbi:rhomboid protease GluP [Ancylomarina subtilis]|uniref:Rhomboid protease GluP n=1 Tax=Ancylomarina subtilis TaxID=1639035 RepID=A0A4Q7VAI8_9BACT|nr:rhomboid family intramembrane serine protease [Ancylomarina subtilis]RZT91752.1 rhomboid protease GluP [Ancylomarina subtilis]